MFTGIVEELGAVVRIDTKGYADSARLAVRGELVTSDAAAGDSIAVNGVCLTVVDVGDSTFTADVMKETLDRSSLGALAPGSPVNLERAVPVTGRLGGHIVQGHVDATATVLDRTPTPQWELVRIGLPAAVARYVVEKGSVTVDGVSLTVAAVDEESFTVSLIPTTLARTTLGTKAPGEPVNLEVDVVAKYVERLLGGGGTGGTAWPRSA
ncbi:MAG: riboflavin synthase [Actinomycetota bacterium]|nr:riboflavin synthase [Actinomycetota bacterium]